MSRPYTPREIAHIVDGELIATAPEAEIQRLEIDSRNIINGANSLFFALVTQRSDGHRYVRNAYEKGVRNFVLSQRVADLADANIILVDDTLQALQELASAHRKRFDYPVLGITGSNGKTIVKEWLFQLLEEEEAIVRSPRSFNSQIGVPLSLWGMKTEDQLALIEAGISKPGEMQQIERMIHPDWGILTNLGSAHAENFDDQEALAKEKLHLFKRSKVLIYRREYQAADRLLHSPEYAHLELLHWSTEQEAALRIQQIEQQGTSTLVTANYRDEPLEIHIPFQDEASIENAIHCTLFLLFKGYSIDRINQKLKSLQAVAMRLSIKAGVHQSLLIEDVYNSDFHSLEIAIRLLAQQDDRYKCLILSDIHQSGEDEAQLYAKVAALIEQHHIEQFIAIGPAIQQHQNLFKADSKFYPTTAAFLEQIEISDYARKAILVKGARHFELERVIELLQQKAHETVLEINLDALVRNLNFYRSKLSKDCKLMAMVKAFSYGSGSHEIASVLQYHRVDYLSVAYADEGIALREAGVRLPIMVMNPETASYDAMIRNRLEPEIYSFRVLRLFEEALKRNRYFMNDDSPFPVHLKLDTGMNRLGFKSNDLEKLIDHFKGNRQLQIVSVFSHLTSSENEEEDQYSQAQIDLFEQNSNRLQAALQQPFIRHILNSAGIVRFPEAHFDMVRLGIGLYGLAPETKSRPQLEPVGMLKSSISQIKDLPKGATVGYSRKGVLKKSGKIATIPIGYADGLDRRLGNGNWEIQIGKKLYPTIGNICMDMCMIDLGDAIVEEGAEVIVYGDLLSVYQMAEKLGTIPYEVLTGIGGRVRRLFYYE